MKVENKVEAYKTEEMDNSSLYICFEGGHQMQQIQGANRFFEQQFIQMLFCLRILSANYQKNSL